MVLALVVDFFITVAALCYGIISAPPRVGAETARLAFPWMGWLAGMLCAPALLIALAHWVSAGQERDKEETEERESAWASQLPPAAQRLYKLVKNAPLFMVCLALILLGATLVAIDSAFSLLSGVAQAFMPYLPYAIAGLTVLGLGIAALAAWLRYKNNRIMAEYAFRREVMEKTGIILISDTGDAIVPPGATGYALGRITAGDGKTPALTQAEPLHAARQGETPRAITQGQDTPGGARAGFEARSEAGSEAGSEARSEAGSKAEPDIIDAESTPTGGTSKQ